MTFRRAIQIAIVGLVLMVGRQVWTVAGQTAKDAVAADVFQFHTASLDGVSVAIDDLDHQMTVLRVMSVTCPVLFECSPVAAWHAGEYLNLQNQRIQLFREMVEIARRASPDAPDIDSLRLEFQIRMVEYQKLLPRIRAFSNRVPSEIAQALDPLH